MEKYTPVPEDAKETYSAVVFWHAERPDHQLVGSFYQKIIFTLPDEPAQLVLTQYPMENVIE